MADIPFGYLCEVDRVEKLEDGMQHRVWIQTLCPKKYTMVFTLWKVNPVLKPGFRFWLTPSAAFRENGHEALVIVSKEES